MFFHRLLLLAAALACVAAVSSAATLAHLNFAEIASKHISASEFYIPAPDNSTIKLYGTAQRTHARGKLRSQKLLNRCGLKISPAKTSYSLGPFYCRRYVRNKKITQMNSFTAANVVLMVHGASYPAEVHIPSLLITFEVLGTHFGTI